MATVDIKLGYSCNNNCRHCVIASQREHALRNTGTQDLSTQQFKDEMLQSRKRGFTSIIFTGGEPTIRRDIFELLDYAKKLGFKITIQTNGRMLYYPDFARETVKYSPHLVIALHSHTPEIHDSITRAKKSFEQTYLGLQNIMKITNDVTGKVVISKKNCQDMKKIAEKFHEAGVRRVYYAFPHAQGNAWKYFDEMVPRYSEIRKYALETIEYCDSKNIYLEFEAFPYCILPGKDKYIAENHPRGFIELRQVGVNPMNWNETRLKIKRKFPQCKECIHDKICEGPWEEYAERNGNEEFKPVK
jgi:MoaA/NifB/PqqE/SkfB family radical SAM enzyme